MNKSSMILKKETRTLGLDVCNPTVIIGAAVRGGLFLDGVISLPRMTGMDNLGKKIRETKYFPELRLIMIHDMKNVMDELSIHRITRLPIITITASNRNRGRVSQGRLATGTRHWETIGLDPSMLPRIETLTKTRGGLPEPLRIAHLLGKLHIFGRLRQEKG